MYRSILTSTLALFFVTQFTLPTFSQGMPQVRKDIEEVMRDLHYQQQQIKIWSNSIQESQKYLDNYEYELSFQTLIKSYNASTKISDWKSRVSSQLLFADMLITLGHRFYDKKQYSKALEAWVLGLKLYPKHPLFHFEKGITLKALGKDWDAMCAFYDAQYFGSFPAFRVLKDPRNGEIELNVKKEDIINAINKELNDLKKSQQYPLSLTFKPLKGPESSLFKVGSKTIGKIIPGIGVSQVYGPENKPLNIYLKDPIQKISEAWGEPDSSGQNSNGKTVAYHKYAMIFELDENSRIVGIIGLANYFSVHIEDRAIEIGASAKKVLEVLGRSHGFETEITDHHKVPGLEVCSIGGRACGQQAFFDHFTRDRAI